MIDEIVFPVSSVSEGEETIEHICFSAIPYEDPKTIGYIVPEQPFSKEESILIGMGYSELDIRAAPTGSKLLDIIEIHEAKIFLYRLPQQNGKAIKRFVVEMKWKNGTEPRNRQAPAAFGLDKLPQSSLELAKEEVQLMVESARKAVPAKGRSPLDETQAVNGCI